MGELTRRQLLAGVLGFGCPSLFAGCSGPGGFKAAPGTDAGIDAALSDAALGCADRFAGGVLVGTVPFTNEDVEQLDVAFGNGLNGRLYTDLSKLGPDSLVTSTETHYIRTRAPDLLDLTKPWNIAVSGLVGAPLDLKLEMLAPKVKTALGPYVMECSGNHTGAAFGMLSAARWSGIPIGDVLAMIDVLPLAKRVAISGFDSYSVLEPGISTPGASWIFTFAELEAAGALLATEMNGAPLTPDHGSPIRLLVPNWYGCTCIKWVDGIALVDDDAPATSQMKEFASRTHQTGVPELARDYKPATMDQAAMPVRLEKWRVAGELLYRVVGVMWGGYRVTDKLSIRFDAREPFVPVDVCPAQTTNATWTLWSHAWKPTRTGRFAIRLAVDDPSIPTKRLDSGFYERTTTISEV
jgi:DMSO/TMAO reductase YedYZ molybdopterin-dependent catalytic subunit